MLLEFKLTGGHRFKILLRHQLSEAIHELVTLLNRSAHGSFELLERLEHAVGGSQLQTVRLCLKTEIVFHSLLHETGYLRAESCNNFPLMIFVTNFGSGQIALKVFVEDWLHAVR